MQTSVLHPFRVITALFFGVIVVGMGVSAWLTWRQDEYLRFAQGRLGLGSRFERTHVVVERRLLAMVQSHGDVTRERREAARQVQELITLAGAPETASKLETVRLTLDRTGRIEQVEMFQSITLFNEAAMHEHAARAAFVARLAEQNALQMRLELGALAGVLVIVFCVYPLAWRRFLKPIDAFSRQLARVAAGDLTPTPLERAEPILLPLHIKFNELVQRLHELEAEHVAREASLTAEVRAATQALLAQQRDLARAERLAATGELAASVAHELRNPLAGIQMTLTNLRSELHDPELVARVDLVVEEVGRLTRLLNELLDSARHAPEAPRPVQLAKLVDEMLALTHYQLPPEVRLENRIDPALSCRLPADRLRQALLNLVLNAAAVLHDTGGSVTLTAARDGGRVRITVSDDGPGFPPDLLEQGIRPFSTARARGTGLGLAIVRRFARDLGGDVELGNRQPHGAEVTLILPADAERV